MLNIGRHLEIVESALNYMALRLNTNNNRDALQRLKEVIQSMRPVIEGQSQAIVEAVKWYLSLNMNFCKSIALAPR